MRAMILGTLCILCAGCGIYQSNWDCPPGKGIGCKPITEVLDMIIENDQGEDFFVIHPETLKQIKEREKQKYRPPLVLKESHNEKLYLLKEHSGEPVIVEGYTP